MHALSCDFNLGRFAVFFFRYSDFLLQVHVHVTFLITLAVTTDRVTSFGPTLY